MAAIALFALSPSDSEYVFGKERASLWATAPPAKRARLVAQKTAVSLDFMADFQFSAIIGYFATLAVWAPCFLKIRVGENSPSL
jgi:hypothetical protein